MASAERGIRRGSNDIPDTEERWMLQRTCTHRSLKWEGKQVLVNRKSWRFSLGAQSFYTFVHFFSTRGKNGYWDNFVVTAGFMTKRALHTTLKICLKIDLGRETSGNNELCLGIRFCLVFQTLQFVRVKHCSQESIGGHPLSFLFNSIFS